MATITVYTVSDAKKLSFKLQCLQRGTTMSAVIEKMIDAWLLPSDLGDTDVIGDRAIEAISDRDYFSMEED